MNRSFKRLTILVLLFLTASVVQAQNTFSLGEAIQYALINNENLKIAKLNIEDADAQVNETRADGLPRIDGTFNYQNNLGIPVSFVPTIFFDPSANPSDLSAVKFGVQHTSSLGVTGSQIIWDGSFFIGLKAARKLREKVIFDEAKTIEDVKEQVMKSYYLVLVNQVRTDLVKSNIATLNSTLRNTKELYENGFAEGIDVSRLQVQMNNLLAEQNAVRQSIIAASNLLKLSMGIPVESEILLTDEIKEFDFTYDANEVNEYNVMNRVEAQQVEYLKQLAVLDIKNVKAQYIPTVKLNAGWGRNTGAENFGNVWSSDREWFSQSYYGVNVNIPIFDGLRKKYSIERKKYQLQTLGHQSSLLRNDLQQQLINAKVALDVSVKKLEVQQETVDLAKEVLSATTEKYREGIGSNLELVVADQDFKQAEVNFLIALYDAIVAKIDLDKSLGKLK